MCRLWHNSMKKTVVIDKRTDKELKKFPYTVQLKFYALFDTLGKDGSLKMPEGKKLAGNSGLFEVRVKHQGQWRAVYAYKKNDRIIILSAFAKKTQKTPQEELEKAKRRLLEYN